MISEASPPLEDGRGQLHLVTLILGLPLDRFQTHHKRRPPIWRPEPFSIWTGL